MTADLRELLGIDEARWERACRQGTQQNLRPEELAAKLGWIDEAAVLRAYADWLGLELLERIDPDSVSEEFLERVPIHHARSLGMIGLENGDGDLAVAVSQPMRWEAPDGVAALLGRPVATVLASREAIQSAINLAYEKRSGLVEEVMEEIDPAELAEDVSRLADSEDLLDVASRAPVIKLANMLLFEAVKRRASDIHIQPAESDVIVRLRIDGVLHDYLHLPKKLQDPLISRIKIMGKMDIAERRLPQDGRSTVEMGRRLIDLRLSSVPSSHGERVVMRLLDKSARLYTLDELGMDPATLARFIEVINVSHGIVLVTGPTGSGKSTTLYSVLQRIDTATKNVITLEDPIEYQLEGISQIQVSDKKGMSFARGLRNVLRQDPDVIMVGEIRDEETSRMAVQSSLTGHLVFSTLHTNDSAGAVTRLLDLGIEPYLAASSLVAVLAQRLVRRICPHCRESIQDRPVADLGGQAIGREYHGAGCPRCLHTGYYGRMGIFELLAVDEGIRELVLARAKASTIKEAAIDAGMRTLRADGAAKVAEGLTTAEEVLRVTQRDDV